TLRALRFWTRLPVPVLRGEIAPFDSPAMERLAPAAPVAGLAVGLVSAGALVAGSAAGFAGWPAAILAVVAAILSTGALHEDGLADLCDGLGGRSAEESLAIMRDSRLGSYGAIAIVVSLLLKISILAQLSIALGAWRAGAALAAASALSRV